MRRKLASQIMLVVPLYQLEQQPTMEELQSGQGIDILARLLVSLLQQQTTEALMPERLSPNIVAQAS